MKRMIAIAFLVVSVNCYLLADDVIGFFMEGGLGYNVDENVGLGFVASSKGMYTGVGAGIVLKGDYLFSKSALALGVNIDFLLAPEIGFVRGEEHYEVHSLTDRASLRVLPYIEVSKGITDWFYLGFGIGYGFNNIYFGMKPLVYDSQYTSYQLSNNSITPMAFFRFYLASRYFLSVNYEADIVSNGELKRVAGDPLAGMANIDGVTDITGVHHRARLVFGYVLGFGD
jgi:hypothetical protein